MQQGFSSSVKLDPWIKTFRGKSGIFPFGERCLQTYKVILAISTHICQEGRGMLNREPLTEL